jgi:hypothetical protein
MTFYLVASASAPTDPVEHLPSRRRRRYPSDMTDAEWALVAPLIPTGRPGRRGGRPGRHSRREPEEVLDVLRSHSVAVVEFKVDPEAEEFRLSGGAVRSTPTVMTVE